VIVVDTNVVVHLFVPSDRTADSERVYRRDPEWAAPSFWRSELANTLVTLVRADRLRLQTATQVMRHAEDRMTPREYGVAFRRVIELAVESGCSGYDCEFVALAEALGTPLVTTDRRVLKAFPRIAVAPDVFGR